MNGQQASYRIIGEEFLWGVDIYSLLEDDNGNIWLSTDNGLFRYNGYDFEEFENKVLQSKSLFCLVKDRQQHIYCANLSGQIMRWENDSLQLFYQLPDSLMGAAINLEVNEEDELIVSAKKPFVLDQNAKPNFIELPDPEFKTMHLLYNNYLKAYLSYDQGYNCLIFDKEGSQEKSFEGLEKVVFGSSQRHFHFLLKHQLYKFNTANSSSKEGDLSTQLDVDEDYSINNIYRLFFGSDRSIWLGDNNKGIHAFDKNGNRLFPNARIFEDYFISAFLEDKAGNIWLGTMDKGLIFIPETSFWHYQFDFNISQIAADTAGNLFLGTDEGEIYKYSNQGDLEKWHQITYGPIRNLYYDHFHQKVLSSDRKTFFELDAQTKAYQPYEQKISAIKDYTQNTNGVLWFCDERNLMRVDDSKVFAEGVNSRFYSLYYDEKEGCFWAGTHQGLMRIKDGQTETFLYQEQKLMVTDIVAYAGRIYFSSTQYGILFFEDGKIKQLLYTPKLLSERINQLAVYDHYLGIASRKGFQLYDIKTKEIYSLTAQDGLLNNNILDFEMVKGQLYLLHNLGLQKIPIALLLQRSVDPQLSLMDWKVNNLMREGKDSVLQYYENQMEWRLQLQTAQHRGYSRFAYRLEGLNEDWQYVSDASPLLRYSALGPGKYRLLCKAIDGEGRASQVQSFSFVVLAPFWQKPWFVVLMFGLSIFGIYLIFRWQIARIEQKNQEQQELIRSKLTALKSQMNPHFIFNSLNSIQDLILKEDIENSYDYIVKFSNMMRTTLNYSEKDFVHLEEEIELLSLYLDLEQLRFGKEFGYEIKNEVKEEIQIPPMLIQPFVENAIKHGLLHKKGVKNLLLSFHFEEDQLLAIIEDNGIGRAASMELKAKYHHNHQSFSTQALAKQFEILAKHYKQKLGFSYEDLEENNIATGTRVNMSLPFIRNL
jgi:ligand-binding sensor domain-containing protein